MEANPQDRIRHLEDQLAQERIGRALAEAKITELQGHIRRANKAIMALVVDVDENPDLPETP